jgi:superfamily I DNA and/or RNA helicase
MNVAMTRARRGLIVVGDSATIGRSPFFRDFLDAVPVVGRWMSAWDDEAEPFEPAS